MCKRPVLSAWKKYHKNTLKHTYLVKFKDMLMSKQFHDFNLSSYFCNIILIKSTFINDFDSNLEIAIDLIKDKSWVFLKTVSIY